MEAWWCIAWRLTGPSLLLWGRGVAGGNAPNAAVLTLFSLVLSSRKTRLKIAVCRTTVKVGSAMGRFLPFNILADDWPLLGESRHSSKEFICSVRPSLNDRFRLGAAAQIIELRQAENDPKETFIYVRATLVTRHRRQRRRQ